MAPTLITGITATKKIGIIPPPGAHLFRIYGGTWDSVTASLQYSEDDGATYRDVDVAGLVGLTSNMDAPVALLCSAGVKFQLELDTPGGSTSLTFWEAYSGPG